jgi:hypothetical protein
MTGYRDLIEFRAPTQIYGQWAWRKRMVRMTTWATSSFICLDTHMLCGVYLLMESVFEIIAEPNRRAILSFMVSGRQSVGEIEHQLCTPPAVSKRP